jgi:hypothetical protein
MTAFCSYSEGAKMYDKIVIRMDIKELEALKKSALIDMRDYRMQARLFIREGLNRRELLSPDPEVLEDYKAAAVKGKLGNG